MPVREDHEYADKAHEKTIQHAGWTYGCHSSKIGDKPRGGPGTYWVRDGYRPVVMDGGDGYFLLPISVKHTTDWLSTHADGRPLKCGHLEELRLKDPQCIGCANREWATPAVCQEV